MWTLFSSLLTNFRPVKPQTVGDDGDAAHGHRKSRENRVKLSQIGGEKFKRKENARCHRNQDDIVKEGPEKVLTDVRIVALLSSMALGTPLMLPLTRITSPASMATSVPVPMAMPTSA